MALNQGTQNTTFTASTTSGTALQDRSANPGARRTFFAITNTTAGATITVAKGSVAAVAGRGIILKTDQTYVESNDSGFTCWQGEIQIVGDMAATIAIAETTETN